MTGQLFAASQVVGDFELGQLETTQVFVDLYQFGAVSDHLWRWHVLRTSLGPYDARGKSSPSANAGRTVYARRTALPILATRRGESGCWEKGWLAVKGEDKDRSLPGTVTFVTLLGIFIVIGWLLMFALTASRW